LKLYAVNLAGTPTEAKSFHFSPGLSKFSDIVPRAPLCCSSDKHADRDGIALLGEVGVVFESKVLYSKMSACLRECCTANALRRLSK
jgi:hypothetical protein